MRENRKKQLENIFKIIYLAVIVQKNEAVNSNEDIVNKYHCNIISMINVS